MLGVGGIIQKATAEVSTCHAKPGALPLKYTQYDDLHRLKPLSHISKSGSLPVRVTSPTFQANGQDSCRQESQTICLSTEQQKVVFV